MPRPSLTPKSVVRIVCLAVVALAVSACGGSGGSSSSSESAPATSEPAPTTGATGAVTAAAGKKVFTANCGGCHALADAGSTGGLGPNLDDLKPDMATVVHQVTNGGGAMPAFGGRLSDTEIQSVAKYVSSVAGSGGGGGVGGTP
jgi:mono/diheme cytochrome c family protein